MMMGGDDGKPGDQEPWIDPDEIPDQSGIPIEAWKRYINGVPADENWRPIKRGLLPRAAEAVTSAVQRLLRKRSRNA